MNVTGIIAYVPAGSMVRSTRLAAAILAGIQGNGITTSRAGQRPEEAAMRQEIQVTDAACGHILTNVNVWSPDSRWIVYDTRSDPAGEKFDGRTIEIVNVETREVREIYRSRNGARCGVATFSPTANKVAFILGPENPTDDWQYNAWHRQGVVIDIELTPDNRHLLRFLSTRATSHRRSRRVHYEAARTCTCLAATVNG